jgi:hypothetical protein
LEPEAGAIVHHDGESLTTVHAEFDVTLNVVVPAGVAGTFWFGGVTLREGPLGVPVMLTSSIAQ